MRVVLCGGGTAGHVNPAIAIAAFIKGRHPGAEIQFVGTEAGIESRLVPNAGFALKRIEVHGLQRKLTLKNIRNAYRALTATVESRSFLKEFAPDLVVGTGGYVSGPVVLAATKLGIPTAIHEQNAFPGLTTRQLSRRVDRVMLGFEGARAHLEARQMVLVGNPIRHEILFAKREEARRSLELAEGQKLVVSFGGSMGSRRFNENITDFMELHYRGAGFRHIHAAGQFGIKWMPDLLREKGVDFEALPQLDLREYIFDMHNVMAAADLVICRAGAITLGELAVLGKPAILIPSPNVTNNHQYHNALAFAQAGAAELIEEKHCSGRLLHDTVEQLLGDAQRLRDMSAAAHALAIFDSTQRIYDCLYQLIQESRAR